MKIDISTAKTAGKMFYHKNPPNHDNPRTIFSTEGCLIDGKYRLR